MPVYIKKTAPFPELSKYMWNAHAYPYKSIATLRSLTVEVTVSILQ